MSPEKAHGTTALSLLKCPVFIALLMGRNVMSIKFGACSAFAATLFGLAFTTMPAHAYVEAGALNCRSPGTASYIVFSARTFTCVFTPSSGAPAQYYQATVQRFGA